MEKFRVQPQAVCRTLLQTLNTYKPLTSSEEQRIISAIENSGVESAVERVLANLSRNTVKSLLESM